MTCIVKQTAAKLKKSVSALLVLAFVATAAFQAGAVTEKEMDQARAIAAKFYVRYVNDGAGYLDNWTPGSMTELEKKLSNDKDRQSLKQFRSAGSPSDYASWNKDQLVAYWSESFFKENASHLDPKGAANGMCRKQIKKAVQGIAVAAPTAPAPEAETAAPTDTAAATPEEAIEENLAEVADEIAAADQLLNEETAQPETEKKSSGTWVYIMVLAILVAVVIFLVIYASKTMKGQAKSKETDDEEETPEALPAPASQEKYGYQGHTPQSDDTRMREKYAQTLAAKAEEIRVLTRQLSDMESLAARLKDENRKLKAELEKAERNATRHEAAPERHHDTRREANHEHRHEGAQAPVHEIYLGRVNSRGIFVRADRHAVDGQSIFKLTTHNGVTGTYTLIHNPLIEEQVLEDPGKWLAGGCFAKDIFDTDGREGIHTETPGTAVFSDGAWRVEKKSRIRYV